MAERRGVTTVFEGPEGVKLDLIEGDVGVGFEVVEYVFLSALPFVDK